jgi:hypothetical protein
MKKFLALAGAATVATLSARAADPPNVRVLYKPESVVGCERKGTIDVNMTELHSDVQVIRSPELRLKVAKLGGNAVLILPGRSRGDNEPAAVYACPLTKDTTQKPKN